MSIGTRMTIQINTTEFSLMGCHSQDSFRMAVGQTKTWSYLNSSEKEYFPILILMKGILNFWSKNKGNQGWVLGKRYFKSCF